jgi:hypothetical protein
MSCSRMMASAPSPILRGKSVGVQGLPELISMVLAGVGLDPKRSFHLFAPQYVCEELLRTEGFTDVRYVETSIQSAQEDLRRGRIDSNRALRSITPEAR